MPRPPSPGAHDALLEAARAEFARHGLERARVEDIARRAGVSKGAFYLHFETKEDAFQEILQRFLGAMEEHAQRRRDAEERFAREQERGAAPGLARQLEFECGLDAELLEVLWRNRHIVAALDGASGKLHARLLGDFRRRMRALVTTRVLDRQAAGQLRPDVEPEVFGDVVVGTYEGFARRMAEMKERPDLAGWARSLLVVLYDGMLARSPSRRGRPARRARPAPSAGADD